jgi:hypothetical protein
VHGYDHVVAAVDAALRSGVVPTTYQRPERRAA